MFVFADKRRFLIGCKSQYARWLVWASLAQSTHIFAEPFVLIGRLNTAVLKKLEKVFRVFKHTTSHLHLSGQFTEVKMKPLLESVLSSHGGIRGSLRDSSNTDANQAENLYCKQGRYVLMFVQASPRSSRSALSRWRRPDEKAGCAGAFHPVVMSLICIQWWLRGVDRAPCFSVK